MKVINHGLQTLSENFLKKLYPNATMSTEGGVIFLLGQFTDYTAQETICMFMSQAIAWVKSHLNVGKQ